MSDGSPAPKGLRPEEVRLLIEELIPLAVEARIEKIFDRGPDAFLLRLKRPGFRGMLLLSTTRGFSRFHLLENPPAAPARPSAATMELRDLLRAGVIRAIDQPGNDRLVRFKIDVPRDGRRVSRTMILELFGRGGRLLIVDGDKRLVRFIHGRGGIPIGGAYRFPEPPQRPTDILLPFDPKKLIPESQRAADHPFHTALAERMEAAETAARLQARIAELGRSFEKQARRRRDLEAKLAKDLSQASRWQVHQHRGELLKGVLHEMKRGDRSIRVTDYYDPDLPEIELELDPRRTPAENVERLFQRARKGKRGESILSERLAKCRQDIELLEGLLVQLTSAQDHTALDAIEASLDRLAISDRRRGRRQKKRRDEPQGPRTFRTREGLEVLAGRTARENDRLTLHVARGNDLFFHRAHKPGPHIILRVPKGRNAAPESIEDAAFLAAYLSGWRGPGSEIVHWTACKYVRKPKGLPAGKVLISQEREFVVAYDPERLSQLQAPST